MAVWYPTHGDPLTQGTGHQPILLLLMWSQVELHHQLANQQLVGGAHSCDQVWLPGVSPLRWPRGVVVLVLTSHTWVLPQWWLDQSAPPLIPANTTIHVWNERDIPRCWIPILLHTREVSLVYQLNSLAPGICHVQVCGSNSKCVIF